MIYSVSMIVPPGSGHRAGPAGQGLYLKPAHFDPGRFHPGQRHV